MMRSFVICSGGGYGTCGAADRCIEEMRETAGKTVAYTVCRLAAAFHFNVQ